MPSDFPAAFAALREILRKHAVGLIVQSDTPTDFALITPAIGPNKQPIWFGAAVIKKSAVMFYLVPLYYNPALLATITPELEKRKQGKTCFNFQRPDDALFELLNALTARALEYYKRAGFLRPGPVTTEQLNAALASAGVDTEALAALRKSKAAAAAKKRAATLRNKKKS